jgi:hypothetical protein
VFRVVVLQTMLLLHLIHQIGVLGAVLVQTVVLQVEVFRFIVPKFGIPWIEVVRSVLEMGVLSQ